MHVVPAAPQKPFAQHGSPLPPQAAHVLLALLQFVPLAVQMAPGQQGWFAPPQLPQLPLAQVCPLLGQEEPDATQLLPSQQPFEEQLFPAQQTVPALPQTSQLPLPGPPQMVFGSTQVRFGQHGSPAPPHDSQTLPTQRSELDPQLPPPQQICPAPPQGTQLLFTQIWEAPQVVPPQAPAVVPPLVEPVAVVPPVVLPPVVPPEVEPPVAPEVVAPLVPPVEWLPVPPLVPPSARVGVGVFWQQAERQAPRPRVTATSRSLRMENPP